MSKTRLGLVGAASCAALVVTSLGVTGAVATAEGTHLTAMAAKFRPGAPGVGDPYFPREGNGGYDVSHYDLDLTYIPEDHHLSGTVTATATATQDLSRFNLDFKNFKINGIKVNGAAATFTRDAQELGITPKAGLPKGKKFTVAVTYAGTPHTVVNSPVVFGADYGWQYYRWLSQVKMTRQEVKDEFRANDGNPEIKARVRRVQREMTRRRMLTAVKTATVVITNPTHFAVALTYRRGEMSAPVVVAKGQDLMAARIKKIAAKHGVPTVENVTLARALYKGAEIGDAIPGELFGAVAEVLAYLVRLKQIVL